MLTFLPGEIAGVIPNKRSLFPSGVLRAPALLHGVMRHPGTQPPPSQRWRAALLTNPPAAAVRAGCRAIRDVWR